MLVSINFALGFDGALNVYKRIVEYPDFIYSSTIRSLGRPEIWIVSDHFAERKDELEALHPEVFKIASKQCWSFDCGLVKKDVGYFHQLLYKNNITSEEVIYIDDMFGNIWSASEADITGIKYTGPKDLEESLRDYGFRFEYTNRRW